MKIKKEGLPPHDSHKTVIQAYAAFAYRFHLGPQQANSRFEFFEKEIIMAGLAVNDDIGHKGLVLLQNSCREGELNPYGVAPAGP